MYFIKKMVEKDIFIGKSFWENFSDGKVGPKFSVTGF